MSISANKSSAGSGRPWTALPQHATARPCPTIPVFLRTRRQNFDLNRNSKASETISSPPKRKRIVVRPGCCPNRSKLSDARGVQDCSCHARTAGPATALQPRLVLTAPKRSVPDLVPDLDMFLLSPGQQASPVNLKTDTEARLVQLALFRKTKSSLRKLSA